MHDIVLSLFIKTKFDWCWKKRVIFPLKQNPNKATRQIILNKQSGIIKDIKKKKTHQKIVNEVRPI